MRKALSAFILLATILSPATDTATGDPRTGTVKLFCTRHPHSFVFLVQNFMETMNQIGNRVETAGFGTAVAGPRPHTLYGLGQCYGDLSPPDCALCYAQARTILPLCATDNNNSAALDRLYLDGCFVRADFYSFFDEYGGPKDVAICGRRVRRDYGFGASAAKAVLRAVAAAPENNGFARESNGPAYVLVNCWGTLNASSCRSCLENAAASALKCLPRSEGRALNTGCFLRYSDSNFLNPPKNIKSSRGTISVMMVAIVSSVVALLIGGAMGVYVRNYRLILKKRKGLNGVEKLSRILNHSGLNFKFSTLEMATGCFDEANKLGQGGYAAVYKGVLSDGREIAVKRLFYNNAQRIADFYNEVNIISSMEHKNLVRLLGCSCSKSESLLVYEFLPNLSLDRFIFDSDKGKLLDWEKRLDIIIGTAEGLLYLHENADVKIIHRDIKASNILLNSKLGAKIADFGLARSLEEDNSHISTKIAGTLGYMAPEYVVHGRLTEKADIYSFGILLLEIISGQRSVNEHMSEYDGSLVICAWKLYIEGRVEELIDPNILPPHQQEGGSNSSSCEAITNEVMKTVRIGLLCTQETPALRPAMPNVVRMLTVKDEELPSPTNPPFIDHNKMEINNPIFGHVSGEGEPLSIATVSHNSFCPR